MEGLKSLLRDTDSSDRDDSDSEGSVMSLLHSLSESSNNKSDNAERVRQCKVGRPKRRESSVSTESANAPQRRPTRRPDPNVDNRNALLARENRRRKKQHLETIEKELEDALNTNRLLLKALKKQLKTSRRLEQERSYFRNILTNRTEILQLVAAINSQMRNKSMGLQQSPQSICSSEEATAQLRGGKTVAGSDTGSPPQNTGPFFMDASNYIDEFFTDLQPLSEAVTDSWNDLLQDEDFGLNTCTSPHSSEGNSDQYNIANEHSYGTPGANDSIDIESLTNMDGGVCLHVARGKVSLEFCPSCHWRASSIPPTQLLQTEFDSLECP